MPVNKFFYLKIKIKILKLKKMKNEKGGPILPTPNPSQNSEQDWANF